MAIAAAARRFFSRILTSGGAIAPRKLPAPRNRNWNFWISRLTTRCYSRSWDFQRQLHEHKLYVLDLGKDVSLLNEKVSNQEARISNSISLAASSTQATTTQSNLYVLATAATLCSGFYSVTRLTEQFTATDDTEGKAVEADSEAILTMNSA
ncbi:hypothetical protein ACP4OV_000157 [Aristida adscensionis]